MSKFLLSNIGSKYTQPIRLQDSCFSNFSSIKRSLRFFACNFSCKNSLLELLNWNFLFGVSVVKLILVLTLSKFSTRASRLSDWLVSVKSTSNERLRHFRSIVIMTKGECRVLNQLFWLSVWKYCVLVLYFYTYIITSCMLVCVFHWKLWKLEL